MFEYKLRFYISFKNADGKHWGNGQLHYCGHTVEDAIAKLSEYYRYPGSRAICTSFLIQRGKGKGTNTKWKDYVKSKA